MTTRVLMISLLAASALFAHCDSLDGPVVQAARRAISSGDVKLVLPWIPAAQEPAIRAAFQQTLAARKLGGPAEKVADTWFFETLVRIHRAGEGAPYEGLKPAGAEAPGAIRMADGALESGQLAGLENELMSALRDGLRERFARVMAAKEYAPGDVEGGRRYVAAYVDFIHFAERMQEAAAPERREH